MAKARVLVLQAIVYANVSCVCASETHTKPACERRATSHNENETFFRFPATRNGISTICTKHVKQID